MEKRPEITRDMIQAYDDYTHLTLDRRRFLDRLAVLTGSTAAALAVVPLLEASSARAAMIAPDDGRVSATAIEYASTAGPIKGYLVKPAAAASKLGTVVVVHENRGLNDHIRDVARRVALEGFIALAPDFLSSLGGTPADEDKARTMFGTLGAAGVASGIGAVDYLTALPEGNGKAGAVGFCWGGGMVNQIAVNSTKLAAGSVFYGQPPAAADVPKIKARMLFNYAGLDDRINAMVPAYEKELKAAGVAFESFIYPNVNHAFHNDTSSARYNKEAAMLAFGRTIALFKATLG